jgi:hypothetical protein
MSMSELLDALPLWGLFGTTVVIVLLSIEGGYWLGKFSRRRSEEEKEGPVGAIVAATLGLLAFILAFTFSLAASRFDARRQIVVEEANAIGTTYLRAGLLPNGRDVKIRKLLREYVEARLEVVKTAGKEVEGPMALVILGGLATSTGLNLVVLPMLYRRFGLGAQVAA